MIPMLLAVWSDPFHVGQIFGWVGVALAVIFTAISGWSLAYRKVIDPVKSGLARWSVALDQIGMMWKVFKPDKGECLDQRLTRMDRGISWLTTGARAESEHSKTPKIEFGAISHLRSANHEALKLLEVTHSEAIGHGWLTVLPASQRDHVLRQMEVAAKEQRNVTVHIIRQKTQSDGVSLTLDLRPVTDLEDGSVGFLAYLNRDGE